MDRSSSPHIPLKGGGAIDFFFELMEPKEKKEVLRDFVKGKLIKLPDFGKVEGPMGTKIVKNPVREVDKDDVKGVGYAKEFLRKFVERGTGSPLLEYDEAQHAYAIKRANTLRHLMKLYVDMDGVLTDFEAAATVVGGAAGLKDEATSEEKQDMYDKVEAAGPEFWSRMPWKSDGKKLWKALKPFSPILLSSPGKFMHAPRGKQDWVRENLPGVPLFLDEDKYRWAERDAVLIDDSLPKILAWREMGGIGIHHKDADTTEAKLLALLSPSE